MQVRSLIGELRYCVPCGTAKIKIKKLRKEGMKKGKKNQVRIPRKPYFENIGREFGKVIYTLLYSKWITNKDLLYSTWNSIQCDLPAWMGEGFGGEWIHVHVWLFT